LGIFSLVQVPCLTAGRDSCSGHIRILNPGWGFFLFQVSFGMEVRG
jgi:hypothetical protein